MVALPLGVVLVVAAAVGAIVIIPMRGAADQFAAGPDSARSSGSSSGSGSSTSAGASPSDSPSASASASPSPSGSTRSSAGPAPGGPAVPGPGSPGCEFAGGACPAAPPIAAAPGKRWSLNFSEEFSGSSYDASKLTPCFDWNSGDCTSTFNNGREHYQPSQVVVSHGTAKLVAAPLSPAYANHACQNSSCTYKAGLLSTARPRSNVSKYNYSFTYGYVESRFKFPATQGFFTAFWMLPADPSFKYRSEIDILEMLGDDPTTMFMTYHYNGRNQSYSGNAGKFHNGACATRDYSTDFVRMGLDWQPDHIAWFINGVECARFSNAAQIENGPMQLILHMMIDNDWQRSWNVGLADPTLVRQLEVDYIRVYQQA